MYRCFILNSGYVESSTNAHTFIYKEDCSFTSVTVAMKQLIIDLSQEFGFDPTKAEDIREAILDLLNGDLQSHGYFLADCGWNTLNLADVEPDEEVVLIDNAVDIISEMVLDELSENRFKAYSHCWKMSVSNSNHQAKLV